MSSTEELKLSLIEYELQIDQINQALELSGNEEEKKNLQSLRNDLLELVQLTKETIESELQSETKHEPVDEPKNGDKLNEELDLFYKDLEDSNDNSNSTPANEIQEEKIYIDKELKDELTNLVGTKCSAPYICSMYGNKTHHNAFISAIDEEQTEELNKLMVKVLYLNPIQSEMVPCSYFLENTCKFSQDKCRYSHGEVVAFDDLLEYKEPNFKILAPKCPVLVKDQKVWVKGIVQHVDFEHKTCHVILEQTKKDIEVNFEELFPLENDDSSDSTDSSDSDNDVTDVKEEAIEAVAFPDLFHPDSHVKIGDFEKYTRGIGSKLMAQMGYIPGTGLGKEGQGRIVPVSAQILPPGSSLDYCMQLREEAHGDKDLFSVSKKLERLRKKQERLNVQAYEREKRKTESNVFNFINDKIFSKPSTAKPSTSQCHKTDLKNHCNKKLNLANFKLSENIRKTEKDLERLNESLKRHKKESEIYKNISGKITEKSSELKALKESETLVTNEQNSRKNKNKLTIF